MSNTNTLLSERMTDAPLVSIIIPVYNVSAYLTQCLESVAGQTYQKLDIILIDDGSTDDSGSICDRFASCDARIRVFHTENRGISAARNLGIEEARGEYIMFVDSDDWIELNAVETLLEAAVRNNSLITAAHCVDEFVGVTQTIPNSYETERIFEGKNLLNAFANGNPRHVAWNKLFVADCFSKYRFPEGHVYEDVFTTWRIMREIADNGSSVTVVPSILYHYRVRKGSVSRDVTYRELKDAWRAYRTKLEGLIECKNTLLPECFNQIARVWKHYCGFQHEEKKQAKSLISEMSEFSRTYLRYVKNGDFPKHTKLICSISRVDSPFIIKAYSVAHRFRDAFKKKRIVYYD